MYSDGWVEMGGEIAGAGSGKTYSFPIILTSLKSISATAILNDQTATLGITYTNSTFTIRWTNNGDGSNRLYKTNWRASGYYS